MNCSNGVAFMVQHAPKLKGLVRPHQRRHGDCVLLGMRLALEATNGADMRGPEIAARHHVSLSTAKRWRARLVALGLVKPSKKGMRRFEDV